MTLIARLENLLAGYDPNSHDFAALEAAIAIVRATERLATEAAVAEMESDPDWRRPEDPVCIGRESIGFVEFALDEDNCEGERGGPWPFERGRS